MDKDIENIKDDAATVGDEATQPQPRHRSLCVTAAVVGTILTVVAWVCLMFWPVVSVWCGVAALVLSAAGIKAGRGCVRDIAITSVVASAVLVLVHIIFTWGLDYAVSTL